MKLTLLPAYKIARVMNGTRVSYEKTLGEDVPLLFYGR